MPKFYLCFALVIFVPISFASQSFAYTYNKQTAGPLTVEIPKPEIVTEIDRPVEIPLNLENKADAELSLDFTTYSIESFEPLEKTFSLKLGPKEKKTVQLKYVAKNGTYTAHYPVCLETEFEFDGQKYEISVVQPIETKIKPVLEEKTYVLHEGGGLRLSGLRNYGVSWTQDKVSGKFNPLQIGWSGTEPNSLASVNVLQVDRGGTKTAFAVHPPYRGGPGNISLEFRVKLPEKGPVTFHFANAIRDNSAAEPPSDGVSFRVLIDGEKVYEKHSESKAWEPNEVDLAKFAGREILLTLETDPGPKRDTTCDACFWGDVFLVTGQNPELLDVAAKKQLFTENLEAIKAGKSDSERTLVFKLESELIAAVTPGFFGLADGIIGFGDEESQVQYDGLKVSIEGAPLGEWPSTVQAGECKFANNRWELPIRSGGKDAKLIFTVEVDGPALRIDVGTKNPEDDAMITSLAFGPATVHAPRVFFGHGYCIEEPKRFSVHNGGHALSTSHIGFDFENDISLLMATSFPPDRIDVDPERKIYTLSVHPGTRFTLLPGREGAMKCAIDYRPLYDKQRTPGVASKAGKLVIDIWGNSYKNDAETIRMLQKYGVKDAIYLVHVWQRYGYDNRLPDIWPPDSRFGSLDDMKDAIAAAEDAGVLYALHDNYIDFYPDAEGYGFDELVFDSAGVPVKAWNNYGVDAQSYRFRPDRIAPYLKRNLDLMLAEISPSSYFVDVFASIDLFDYYDREGKFHSRKETLKHWNEAFDTIRERLGERHPKYEYPPTISEAGSDFLIGHLDGSDCQFMFISEEPGEHRINIPCKDWSRVPWFDLVNHTNFSLHGVGYSSRYEAGRGRALHGIESDDYITAEILTGHAMMTDGGSKLRGTVRKTWLAQDFINNIRGADIEEIEFANGNIHVLLIKWSNLWGAMINRSSEDFGDEETILIPPMGFFAARLDDCLGILRDTKTKRVYEFSTRRDRIDNKQIGYLNHRQVTTARTLPVTPKAEKLEYLGGNRIKLDIAWEVFGKVPFDYNTFVHLAERKLWWAHKTNWAAIGGGFCEAPSSTWKEGKIVQPMGNLSIPDDLPAGKYDLVVGLYDSRGNGQRAELIGPVDDSRRYIIGHLRIERDPAGKVANIEIEAAKPDPDEHLYERLVPNEKPFETPIFPGHPNDGSLFYTKGAFRWEFSENGMLITPLPDEPDFELEIRLSEAEDEGMVLNNIKLVALDENGKEIRNPEFRTELLPDGSPILRFKTRKGEFQYRIEFR